MFLRENKGFTLIEVIVSIALIAIIAVIMSNIISTSIKARNISHERLQILAVCTSYINEIKSIQGELTSINDLETWLHEKGFIKESNYYKKTEVDTPVDIKIYINQNLDEDGLFELMIKGSSQNVDEIFISTVVKGARQHDE